MEGASDYEKASSVINCLDTASIDLVMQHLTSVKWTYLQAKTAIIEESGNSESIATCEIQFLKFSIPRKQNFFCNFRKSIPQPNF